MLTISTHNFVTATIEALLHAKNAPDVKNRAKLLEQIKQQGFNPNTWAAQYYVNFIEGDMLECAVSRNDRIQQLETKAAAKPFQMPSLEILKQFCDTGECFDCAYALSKKFPRLKMDSGFYVKRNGEAAEHAWCKTPDGTIIDTTHGQFNRNQKILIAKPGTPEHKRYFSYDLHHNPECLHKKLNVGFPCALTQEGRCDYQGPQPNKTAAKKPKIIETPALQQNLFNKKKYPVKPPKPLMNVPDAPDWSGNPIHDLEYLGDPAMLGITAEDVLNHYNVHHELITFPNNTTVLVADLPYRREQQVVIEDDGQSLTGVTDWIFSLSENQLTAMCPTPEFHDEFWESPSVLYHATKPGLVKSILKNGLKMDCKIRGTGNRNIGCAVFATPNVEIANGYGEALILIHCDKMKADGYTPRVTRETGFDEDEARACVSSRLGLEDFYVEPNDSTLDPDTVVFFGNIPAKYLSLDQPKRRTM